MSINSDDWTNSALREAPYYYPGMSVEEYERERRYFYDNIKSVVEGKYLPLWKQQELNM